MALISAEKLSLNYGPHIIFDAIEFVIEPGERICLVGRNGEGKSTLLKLLAHEIEPDDGLVRVQDSVLVTRLTQEVPDANDDTVFQYVGHAFGDKAELIERYHDVVHTVAETGGEQGLDEMARLQQQMEVGGAWSIHQRVETLLSKLELDADAPMDSLSGGWRRRVALARALVLEPDVLLLDEPTNHLDIEAINWLENTIERFRGTVIFVTHDRAFVDKLATRILELDRGHINSYPGRYAEYQQRKQKQLEDEATENAEFDKKLAKEEVWIRQGIKARRTRNEGRVRALKKMRDERQQRRERSNAVSMKVDAGARSGARVIEADNISYAYDDKIIAKDFSIDVMRGDRIGLVGSNGCGKTTLVRLLLKELQPDSGSVSHGSRLQVAYYDQLREHLDPEKSVMDNLEYGAEFIEINGQSRHVLSYLQDFLFSPARARSPLKSLSGGERNRLLLARLFLRPANVLVLDEPTNDLDVETLELLESLLIDYSGTLIVVSHDRAFLDNVATSLLIFTGNGKIEEHIGGYSDWQHTNALRLQQKTKQTSVKETAAKLAAKEKAGNKRKLSYKEQRELETLPQLIEDLESRQKTLSDAMSAADYYQQDKETISQTTQQAKEVEQQLAEAYSRWEQLETPTV
ncbi:MAG: ATP-binding cassette domain-containing protein [Proteobacteria bacterium]|nr:ATP-binding cassette domain-containing protein [Pseudomonadota bacterium]